MRNIIDKMNSLYPISDETIQILKENTVLCHFPKRHQLIEADKFCKSAYFIEEGIVHVGVTNIPAMVPDAANETFSRYIFPIVEDTANYGLKEACKRNPVLRSGVIMVNGKITQKEVADSQGVPYTPLDVDTML